MDFIPDKLWALIAAVASALGGFVLYERKRVDDRISAVEKDIEDHKVNLAVVKEALSNLRDDTQEIKEFQKATVDILTAMNMRKRK
jgi:hypothetical protein